MEPSEELDTLCWRIEQRARRLNRLECELEDAENRAIAALEEEERRKVASDERVAKELWYADRLVEQGGKCAICGGQDSHCSLAKDHCHETGKWRGRLCSRCNLGLGCFLDSRERLAMADRYLERWGPLPS